LIFHLGSILLSCFSDLVFSEVYSKNAVLADNFQNDAFRECSSHQLAYCAFDEDAVAGAIG